MSTTTNLAVIDDDRMVRDSLASLLRSYGYSCHCFESAEIFLKSVQFPRIQCVLTDIQMPGLSGWQLAEILNASCASTPIILMTASLAFGHGVQARPSNVLGVLAKPFDSVELIDLLEQALSLVCQRYRS